MPEIKDNIFETNYKHVISLGFFCSVALELERKGLRDASYPFDWLISDFQGVIKVIENRFYDFLNVDFFSQNKECMHIFKNSKYNIEFYHDFTAYKPLADQIDMVKNKYTRRIKRFYSDIKEPTLFVRYIKDYSELCWIENNMVKINQLLKSFCEYNDIIFVGNMELTSDKIHIYSVIKDKNDSVARMFLLENLELNTMLESIPNENKGRNLELYKRKANYRMNIRTRLKKKFESKIIYKIKRKYVWYRQYS